MSTAPVLLGIFMVDRPKGESDTLDALSEILELYLSQQLKNFENSVNLKTGSLLTAFKEKTLFFLLYIRRIETDHLNHI